ncbi:uncharacterized protein [Populus alba]|uniref:uncharacterized protein n=1 Tax=Populus alba TaxID=43335 RepID=UPI00158DA101|nr:ankyrin repeat-containing protein At5g02620-like [Populus alba]
MDAVLFKAAEAGDIDPFENYQTSLDQLLTPDENTILHANKKGETPLHLAARYGHSNVVRVLIDRAKARPTDRESGVTEAKKMLRMTNEEQDTALHVAARNKRSHVVEILTKEDPEFSYSANVDGETPLYIAAASYWWGQQKVIDEILTNCISVDYGGPNGRTALHAASRVGDYETPLYIAAASGWGQEREKVIDEILTNCMSVDYGGPNGRTALHEAIRRGETVTARKLLEKEKTLTKTTDENGWSPLHCAAFYLRWSIPTVKVLLEYDASAAYIAETEKKRTALHIAAIRGHVNAMKEIVSGCPACCELVDNRGWNALHYAVASKISYVFEECLEIPELARLGTKKDDNGNTPFHLIAALANEKKQWGRVLYEGESCGLNKRKLSVDDINFRNLGEMQKEKEEALSKAKKSHLVVAALIATVTFAAAFTLPGGYKSDRGTAMLVKKAAFIVFVISDAISMVLSIFVVFIHFWISPINVFRMDKKNEIDEYTTLTLFAYAMLLTMIGMGTMIIAFVTGTYTVLDPSLGLAISTCLIGLNFFFLLYLVFRFICKNKNDLIY